MFLSLLSAYMTLSTCMSLSITLPVYTCLSHSLFLPSFLSTCLSLHLSSSLFTFSLPLPLYPSLAILLHQFPPLPVSFSPSCLSSFYSTCLFLLPSLTVSLPFSSALVLSHILTCVPALFPLDLLNCM